MTLELGDSQVLWNGRKMDESPYAANIQSRTPGRTVAAIHPHNGVPTLIVER